MSNEKQASKSRESNLHEYSDIEHRILDAAREVFIRKGYDSATMGDIALLASMSRTSVNYYFRNKERLFEAIFEEIITMILPQLVDIAGSDEPFLDKIDRIITRYIDLLLQKPNLPVFLAREIHRDPHHVLDIVLSRLQPYDVPGKLMRQMEKEMEQGNLKRIPAADITTTMIGSIAFPMIAKELLTCLFFDDDPDKFIEYYKGRRELTMGILRNLLKPE